MIMAKNNTPSSRNQVSLTPLGWLAVGILLLLFWEPLLTVALLGAGCWIIWRFREPLWNFTKAILTKLKILN